MMLRVENPVLVFIVNYPYNVHWILHMLDIEEGDVYTVNGSDVMGEQQSEPVVRDILRQAQIARLMHRGKLQEAVKKEREKQKETIRIDTGHQDDGCSCLLYAINGIATLMQIILQHCRIDDKCHYIGNNKGDELRRLLVQFLADNVRTGVSGKDLSSKGAVQTESSSKGAVQIESSSKGAVQTESSSEDTLGYLNADLKDFEKTVLQIVQRKTLEDLILECLGDHIPHMQKPLYHSPVPSTILGFFKSCEGIVSKASTDERIVLGIYLQEEETFGTVAAFALKTFFNQTSKFFKLVCLHQISSEWLLLEETRREEAVVFEFVHRREGIRDIFLVKLSCATFPRQRKLVVAVNSRVVLNRTVLCMNQTDNNADWIMQGCNGQTKGEHESPRKEKKAASAKGGVGTKKRKRDAKKDQNWFLDASSSSSTDSDE
jgi:hypothetical protein